jgi:hypothetical protein
MHVDDVAGHVQREIWAILGKGRPTGVDFSLATQASSAKRAAFTPTVRMGAL